MTLTTLSEWLRCPICTGALSPIPPLVLGCDAGHRFDAKKHGYVNLLSSQPRIAGDTPDMLDARSALLSGGAYDPVVRVVADSVLSTGIPQRLLDAGSGTGHYSSAILGRTQMTGRALATDIAPDAVHRSVRRLGRERADGLVADTWRPLPIRDGAADAIINVFAPRNVGEFRRVLAPDGCLVIVTPQQDHLLELRRALPMLDVPADKSLRITEDFADDFVLEQSTPVRYTLAVSHETAMALRSMGPSAHHGAVLSPAAMPPEVTVAVDVLRFRSRTHAAPVDVDSSTPRA
ncbi:putative RNA methyltransferase [Rathayibacter sp. KR2-224]|uniref:putative RNA methyltransferase n=1 Tax=Rathayibacter sp. KR2-224 TaxID=3400913 RepID=UPI003C0479F3